MNYLWKHLDYILSAYDGRTPLHHFLKVYFAAHKKLGSRDRRGLSDASYAWYRAGKALGTDTHSAEEKQLAAMLLCGLQPKAFASALSNFATHSALLSDRITALASAGFNINEQAVFDYPVQFSTDISAEDWRSSMLRQPRLFLRIRKARKTVEDSLIAAGISHEWISDTCLALPNGTDVQKLLPPDTYVVQDASSQATGAYLKPDEREAWWDCCAGAGGKSLMLLDAAPRVHLTATDIRASILQNLKERVRMYGHAQPHTVVLNAADESDLSKLGHKSFDGVICDVPCTGSGTWARTPEGCYFFNPATLDTYTTRQKSILRNAACFLKTGGRLVYITCSVFRAENEDILTEVAPGAGLKVVSSELINGIAIGADSLFVAVLERG